MSEDVAEKALDFTFKSPSPAITLEFQGGESLLVFDRVKQIVLGAEKRNLIHQKLIQFVITTNLSQLTDEMLDFCDEHQILISTSLDGPEWLHNSNRPRPGRDAYQKTIEGINKARHILGHDRVGALMTTTKATLAHITDVIDEYINHDFDHIVLRPLSPYGFAISKKVYEGYSTEEWIESYKVALDYILEINRQGHFFAEGFTALLVSKIFSPTPTSYVDLQSPTGAGIAAISFNYDGNVYATDESRMLAEMNDYYFKMGNLESDTYEDIMLNESYLDVLESTILDSVPMCEQCAYKPFCGSDPVYHHALHNDDIGHKMDSGHCKKMTGVLDHLFELMKNDEIKQLLLKWIRL
jgi:His-Xaa-Ser system radical SAM maturase HxsB